MDNRVKSVDFKPYGGIAVFDIILLLMTQQFS